MKKDYYEQFAECYSNIFGPMLQNRCIPDPLNPRRLIYVLAKKRRQLYEKYNIRYTNITLAEDFSMSPRTINRLNNEFRS